MTSSETRMVARLARRTARREWRRTTLIAALVALPVMVAVVVAGLMRANEVTPEERATGELGAADLRVQLFVDGREALDTERLADTLAETQEQLAGLDADAPLRFRESWRPDVGLEDITNLRVTDLAYDDPLAEGIYQPVAGRAPEAPGEVALSSHALQRAELAVGDEIELSGIGTAEIVGSLRDPLAVRQPVLAVTPNDLDALAAAGAAPGGTRVDGGTDLDPALWSPTWLVGGVDDPRAAAAEINEGQQAAAESRAGAAPAVETPDGGTVRPGPSATLDARTRASIRQEAEAGSSMGLGRAMTPQLVATLVAGVLLAEVALIAGAAYATGARRRLRELGLLGANGATTAHLRGAVVGEASVTGLLGALVGVVGGVAALTFGSGLAQRVVTPLITGVELTVTDVVGPVVAGVAAVTLAAWLPARTAATVPTTTALQGRMPLARPKRWIVPAGVVLAAFGAVLFLVGVLAGGGLATLVAGLGVLFAVGGTAMLTVPLVALGGRYAHRLPALPRLVVRDSARQRTRAAAASASAMVVLMVPVLIATMSLSTETNKLVSGLPEPDDHVLLGQTQFPADGPPPRPAVMPDGDAAPATADARAEASATVAEHFPDATRASVTLLDEPMDLAPSPRFAPARDRDAPPANVSSRAGPTSVTGSFGALATPELLAALDDEAVADAVADDRIVVLGIEERETTVTIDGRSREALELPVPVLQQAFPRVLLPEAAAAELGLEESGTAELFVTPEPIDNATRNTLYSQLHEVGITVGYRPPTEGPLLRWIGVGGALLVALLILALVTMLSATESDRDLGTMVAVGAAPRLRRRFLGLQSGLHALIGAVLGTPLAIALTWAALSADSVVRAGPFGAVSTGHLWLDWPVVAAVVVGVPLLIAGVIALLMRSAATAPPRRAA